MRINRENAIQLKLDITSDCAPIAYQYQDVFAREAGERFNGDYVNYEINGKEYTNIYGLTISAKKEGGTKTEVWIKRSLEDETDIPSIIDEMEIMARLSHDKYEYRYYGTFRIKITGLVLVSDETEINAADAVIGPLRYYAAGTVSADVFSESNE